MEIRRGFKYGIAPIRYEVRVRVVVFLRLGFVAGSTVVVVCAKYEIGLGKIAFEEPMIEERKTGSKSLPNTWDMKASISGGAGVGPAMAEDRQREAAAALRG